MTEPRKRTESQIRDAIKQAEFGRSLHSGNEAMQRRFDARIQELRKELRALDDTPVVRYRGRGSNPPPAAGSSRP